MPSGVVSLDSVVCQVADKSEVKVEKEGVGGGRWKTGINAVGPSLLSSKVKINR